MKTKLQILIASIALALVPIVAFSPIVLTTGCGTVQDGSDAVVVRAQQAQTLGLQVCDSFLLYEFNNRPTLLAVNPGIKKAADSIRIAAPKAFESLNASLSAYKTNRTPENKANLITYLAVVEQLQAEAFKWLSTAKTSQPPTQ